VQPGAVGKRQLFDLWSSGSLAANLARGLVSWDSFVRRAPADLDLDGRFPSAQGCYHLPRLKGVGLSGPGSSCVIRVITACASAKMRTLPSLCRLARSAATAKARALRVVRSVEESHVDFPCSPSPSLPRIPPPPPPFSPRDPSVQSTNPGCESDLHASCAAHSASAMETFALSSVGPSSGR